jgi:hypothetical protein
MKALKFIKERKRMCKIFNSSECKGCPALIEPFFCAVGVGSTVDPTDQIAMVKKWSTAHPHKTRQDVVLEQWPNAETCNDNVLSACPKVFDRNFVCHFEDEIYNTCSDCRRKFWMQEVE